MKKIKLFLQGFIIGIGKIIPGVSGSLIALNLGLYENIIESITKFYKDKKSFLFLLNIGVGIITSIILGSKIISYLLTNYYYFTMIIFAGLLLGSNEIKINNKNSKIITIVSFLLTLLLFLIKNNNIYVYKNNCINNLYIILMGFIDALTTIIPAVSGTAIFMVLGSYNQLLEIFSNPFSNIQITILFFIGLLSGIIIISKMINILFKKNKEIFYSIINGLFLSSILFLIIETLKKDFNILGFPILLLAYKVGKIFTNKHIFK